MTVPLVLVAAFALAAALFVASFPEPSRAQASGRHVFYVARSGHDSAGGSSKHPFRTVQHAVRAVPAGSLIRVRRGTYRGFEVKHNGITVAAAPGAKVHIRGGGDEDVVQFTDVRNGGLRGLKVLGSDVQYGSAVKVTDSQGVRIHHISAYGSRTFGIVVVDSRGVKLDHNNIFHNASGIEERRAKNLRIVANDIHDNTKEVDSGRGQEGITFYESTGRVEVSGNHFHNNRTHLEVYGASHLVIHGNSFRAGQVMETGTGGQGCRHNKFVRNVATRGSTHSNGMILRCAKDMLVAQNVFDGFDDFGLYIVNGLRGVSYGASIAGLRVLNNIVVGGRAYSLGAHLPRSVTIDHNLINNDGSKAAYGDHLAYVDGPGNAETLRQFTRWTGFDKHGVGRSPMFVNRSGGNFHLRAHSPAINSGAVLASPYKGRRPDIGRYERR
ncbi:MAG TPA: right-handed parallel beta-helix repeat-containing protein [Actinomycetes bacterium]|nr:right-handed parallel beta-helix repeat-containing protein [Actinomycetes bacterium]